MHRRKISLRVAFEPHADWYSVPIGKEQALEAYRRAQNSWYEEIHQEL